MNIHAKKIYVRIRFCKCILPRESELVCSLNFKVGGSFFRNIFRLLLHVSILPGNKPPINITKVRCPADVTRDRRHTTFLRISCLVDVTRERTKATVIRVSCLAVFPPHRTQATFFRVSCLTVVPPDRTQAVILCVGCLVVVTCNRTQATVLRVSCLDVVTRSRTQATVITVSCLPDVTCNRTQATVIRVSCLPDVTRSRTQATVISCLLRILHIDIKVINSQKKLTITQTINNSWVTLSICTIYPFYYPKFRKLYVRSTGQNDSRDIV